MAYTPFALMASVIILSMAFTSPHIVTGDISHEYAYSVQESWAETQTAYAIKSTDVLAGITQNNEVNNYEEAAANLTSNGIYEGNPETSHNYINWSKEVEKYSQIKNIELENLNVTAINLSIKTESNFKLELGDRNHSFNADYRRKVYGVEDPILSSIDKRDIKPCSFEKLASLQYTGGNYNGSARGKPVINPADASLTTISNKAEKILLTSDNITDYEENALNMFAGYSTEEDPAKPGDYNSNYVVNAPRVPDFESKQRAIIHEGLWKANFFRAQNNECYLPTANQDTPSMTDRIENKTRGSTNQGIYTLVEPVASESDVGYERKDGSSLALTKLEGVSKGEGETWVDFQMSNSLANQIGLNRLK
jgi:hypothetical protein